jgi:hypothetical protein
LVGFARHIRIGHACVNYSFGIDGIIDCLDALCGFAAIDRLGAKPVEGAEVDIGVYYAECGKCIVLAK